MSRRKLAANLFTLLLLVDLLCFMIPIALSEEPMDPHTPYSPTLNPRVVATTSPIQFEETANYVKLNFLMFTIEFYKGSADYNKIYDYFGNILVYNDRIVLEYYTGTQWKQRGTPTDISWTKISDYHYNVTRFYTDYLETTYNVTYTVKADSPIKITVDLISGQTDQYRIAWYPSGITKLVYQLETNMITFGEKELDYAWVNFDWQDVYQTFGDITEVTVETVAQGRKANIYFNIGEVSAGQKIRVDPSVVSTSTCQYATGHLAYQRKSFYAEGLFWVFYENGTDFVYRTSRDGFTWSNETFVNDGSMGNCGCRLSVFFTGTDVDYVQGGNVGNGHLHYRRGTPYANGTIVWWDAEQDCLSPAGVNCSYDHPSLSVDSEGYAWVGYRWKNATDDTYKVCIAKNSLNNGTWQTDSGFPYVLDSGYWGSFPFSVSLLNSRVYAVWRANSTYNYKWRGTLWNGTSWGDVEDITTSSVYSSYAATAVNEGNDIHFTFLAYYPYRILYHKRTYGTGWGSEITVNATISDPVTRPCLSIDAVNNELYCFWALNTTDHIYYKKFNGVSWDANPTDWIDESTNGFTDLWTSTAMLQSFYKDYGGKIGIVYMTNTTSPYEVRHAYLVVGESEATEVGTTTTNWAVGIPSQRQTFYAQRKYWVFYTTGSSIGYRTSSDGSSWSDFTTIRPLYTGWQFDTFFDGTYVHYVYAGSTLYYRRGLVNADGTVTWASEQTAGPPITNMSHEVPSLGVDSEGCPMIGYRYYNSTSAECSPYVTRSSLNNGLWSTASGFPYQLNSTDWTGKSGHVSVVPLLSNKTYVWWSDNDDMWGRIYNFTDNSMSSAEYVDLTDEITSVWARSIVADGNDVHITYLSESQKIIHIKRTFGSNWGSETTVFSASSTNSTSIYSIPTATTDSSKSMIYCFWAGSPKANYVYYKKYNITSGNWDSEPTEWMHEIDVMFWESGYEDAYRISSSYQDYGERIPVLLLASPESPFKIKFRSLSFTPTIGSLTAPNIVYANQFFSLNATINDDDGVNDFYNATLDLTGDVTLKWVNSTNVFSVYSDPNNYCTLDAANSTRTSLNSTAYRLSWRIKFNWNYTDGSISLNATVYDNHSPGKGCGTESQSVFSFEADLIVVSGNYVPSKPTVNQIFQLTGQLYYYGTTTPPEDTGITAYASRGGTIQGSTTSITNGAFSISVTAPPTEGLSTWLLYSVTAKGGSQQNETLNIYIHPSGTPPPGGTSGSITPTLVKFYGASVSLGSLKPGQQKTFQISIDWIGTNEITITSMDVSLPGWVYTPQSFPQTFWRGVGETNGTASVTVVLAVPDDTLPQSYDVSFVFTVEAGTVTSQVSCIVTFKVYTPSPPPESIQNIIGLLLVGCLGIVLFAGLVAKKRKPPL